MKSKTVNFNYADFEVVKNIALSFPDTEESISHEGTPSVKVRGKTTVVNSFLYDLTLQLEINIWTATQKFFIYQTILKPIHTFVCGHIITTKTY